MRGSLLNAILTLTTGRDRVEAGWCQGYFSIRDRNKMKYCALGAVEYRYKCDDDGTPLDYLLRAINKLHGKRYTSYGQVAIWNNDPFRHKDEVVEAFDLAINMATTDLASRVLEEEEVLVDA